VPVIGAGDAKSARFATTFYGAGLGAIQKSVVSDSAESIPVLRGMPSHIPLLPACRRRVSSVWTLLPSPRECAPPCGETPPLARRETVAKITIRAVPKQRLIPPFGTQFCRMAVSNNTK